VIGRHFPFPHIQFVHSETNEKSQKQAILISATSTRYTVETNEEVIERHFPFPYEQFVRGGHPIIFLISDNR
jgi:hypothetical protein